MEILKFISPFRLVAAMASLIVAVVIVLLVPLDVAERSVRYLGHYVILATLICLGWGIYCYCRGREEVVALLSRNEAIVGLGSLFLGLWVVFIHADFGYKIALDDYVLSATGRSLHESREVAATTLGLHSGGDFIVQEAFVDKRPFFYPFLISLLHDMFGYSSVHPFAVNALACALFLCLVFLFGRAIAGLWGGVLSVLLWASLPLLSQNATGAGMEMVNLLMLQFLMILCFWYLREPSRCLEGIISISCVLLTYSRYESGLFIVPAVAVLVLGWIRAGKVFLASGTLIAPLLLIVGAFQLKIYSSTVSSWELSADSTAPFAWEYLVANLPHAFNFYLSTDHSLANSLLLGVLALPVFVSYFVLVPRGFAGSWKQDAAKTCFAVFSFFLIVHVLLMLSFHAGKFDQRFVSRYSLPFNFFIICGAVIVLEHLFRGRKQNWYLTVMVVIFCLQVTTLASNSRGIFNHSNFAVREFDWLTNEAHDSLGTCSLYLDVYPIFWALDDLSVISPGRALRDPEWVKRSLRNQVFAAVYVVRRSTFRKGEFRSDEPMVDLLFDEYPTHLVAEKSFRPMHLTQIYKVDFNRSIDPN